MAEWLIRVIGKERTNIDKDLLVQAILALGRQLWAEEQAAKQQEDASRQAANPSEGSA
jgi:hypothetical protein